MASRESVVVVVGLGEIGKPLYDLLLGANPRARGVDVKPVEVAEPVSLLHIAYPFAASSRFVETTAAYAAKYQPEVIVVHSTVVPGTTRALAAATRRPAVYSPVRGKHTKMQADLRLYRKFVAGTDADAVARVTAQLEDAGLKTSTLSSPEALELAKLCETTYFGLLIAWAQEMDRFARQSGADYREIPKFFEEIDYLPRHIFWPGYIGGHCVIPNIGLLKTQFTSELLDAVLASNERKRLELGEAALEREHGKDRARLEPKKMGGT